MIMIIALMFAAFVFGCAVGVVITIPRSSKTAAPTKEELDFLGLPDELLTPEQRVRKNVYDKEKTGEVILLRAEIAGHRKFLKDFPKSLQENLAGGYMALAAEDRRNAKIAARELDINLAKLAELGLSE